MFRVVIIVRVKIKFLRLNASSQNVPGVTCRGVMSYCARHDATRRDLGRQSSDVLSLRTISNGFNSKVLKSELHYISSVRQLTSF